MPKPVLTKRELKKLAEVQIFAVVEAMDLGQLFGDELYELSYEDGYEWVADYLEEIKKLAVVKLTPRRLR